MSFNKRDLYKYFKKEDELVILDIGAASGGDSNGLLELFPNARVYAFEADDKNYEKLSKNFDKGEVKTYNLAVSDITGEDIFYRSGVGGGGLSGSLLKPKLHLERHPNIHFEEPIKVKSIKLEDWAKKEGIKEIDFIWMDVNGGEMKVLLGRGNLKIKVLYTEVFDQEVYENTVLFDTLKTYLETYGYRLIHRYIYDALFILKEFEKSLKRG